MRIRKCINCIEPYRTARKVEYRIGIMSNENNYGPSQKVMEALAKLQKERIFRYPDPGAEKLRDELARYCSVRKENVVAFNGADEAIRDALSLFLEKGTSLLTYSPTFPIYKIVSDIFGAEYVSVPLESDFSFTEKTCKKLMAKISKRTRAIALCNPNNPTGTRVPREFIEKILESTEEAVVVDEAYYEFSGETVIDLLPSYENLIILRSMSKAFGLAGLRIGYAIASKEICDCLLKTKCVFNVNGVAQALALAALSDIGYMKDVTGRIVRERDRVSLELKRKGIKVFPSSANFLLVETSPLSSDEFVDKLVGKGILVRGVRLKGGEYARITIGREEENDALIKAAGEVVGG